MGLKKFAIHLDRPVHYAGEIIAGRLVVEVGKPLSMSAIYLKYSGKGTVQWNEIHQRDVVTRRSDGNTSRNTVNYTKTYSNTENYLGLRKIVYGNDVEDCELTEGEHVFAFNFHLPMNLPSSFEGLYGRVRYSVKATIHRRWKFNHVTVQPVTVVSVCDLNHLPLAADPVVEETSKNFFGHSKPLVMSIRLPVRGFVPGQIIPVRVCLDNQSGVHIKCIYVTLEQQVTFHASMKPRTVKMSVFKNEFPVRKGLGCEKVPINLELPVVPPSYLEFCQIIELNYQLNVEARVKAWYRTNLKTHTEIIVGNIPLMSYQKPIPLRESSDEENPSAADCQPPNACGFVYEDLPTPNYEQSVKLEACETENPQNNPNSASEVTEFTPLYPVYKFATTQG